MTKKLLVPLFIFIPLVCWAAITTITGSGNWSDPANWSGGNVGDDLSEDVDMTNTIGAITILNGETFTIGDYNMANGNTLNVDSGGTLIVGSMSANKITTGNNVTINVSGVLEIWGDLLVNNDLTLNTSGTGSIIIHGNIDMGNNAMLDIQGSVQVDGDFLAGTNTMVNVDGSLNIDGNAVAGNDSVLTGTGTVDIGGTCTGPDTFCASGPLPIELLFFRAIVVNEHVLLTWATASEENFDFFVIERSLDAKEFYPIDSLSGVGSSNVVVHYQYLDRTPHFGRSFYRLKAVDFDGFFEYFEIKSVVFEPVDYRLYPNPLIGNILNAWARFDKKQTAVLTIFNTSGKEILRTIIHPGINVIEFEDYNLPPGTYIVKLEVEGKQKQRKLIKI